MKIAVVCANGRAGRRVVEEALARGLEVTAVVRGENKTPAPCAIVKDLFELTREDLAGFDAVVDAFAAWTPETFPEHSTSLVRLCDLLAGSETRLVVVGGAGSLYLNAEHTMMLQDAPDFPDGFKPLASAMGKALSELRGRKDVAWTYMSPAADFRPEGGRTGRWLVRGEEFSVNDQGESTVSYADYAAALVEELVSGGHIRERISVIGA